MRPVRKVCPVCPVGEKPDPFTCECSVPVSTKKDSIMTCKVILDCKGGTVPDINNCGCVSPEERKKQLEEYYGAEALAVSQVEGIAETDIVSSAAIKASAEELPLAMQQMLQEKGIIALEQFETTAQALQTPFERLYKFNVDKELISGRLYCKLIPKLG